MTNSAPKQITTPAQQPETDLHNQGLQYFNTKNYEQAIEFFRQALHHNINRADTHFMLGVCYNMTGELETAIDHYQNAGLLAPTQTEYWTQLSRARVQAGRYKEALSAARQARRYAQDPHAPALIQLLGQCIAPINDFDINPHFVEEVTRCFQTPQVSSDKLIHTAQKLFLHQAVVKKLLEHHSQGKFRDFEALLQDKALNWSVLSHPLFGHLMSDQLISDRELEKTFQALRFHFLQKSKTAPLTEEALWPQALHFISALAQQCFIGEYVYHSNAEEKQMLETLKDRIAKTPAPYDVALLACYAPLNSLDNAMELARHVSLKKLPELQNVLRSQILEPAEELKIMDELPVLSSIDDKISLMVKEQYEANPYPRWVSTAIEHESSLRQILKFQFPYMTDEELPDADFDPEILIAGCGTGKQSIGNALILPHSKQTSIDITAASLAYAQRKTKEMGITNIEYGLADILKLGELNKKFDMIHCGGVLHHMRDPMEGWRVLRDILKPGGYMMIALYSEIARRPVVAAREYIAQQCLDDSPEGILETREHIKKLPDDHVMKSLMDWRDFYSLSEFRDFIFHVQEHRFTALDLKKAIHELGLIFLGFQQPMSPAITSAYRKSFPNDPYGLNLDNWHAFELKNPGTFVSMYHMWLQKPPA